MGPLCSVFLDEFERETMRKFPHHRFTVQRQKAMDAEFQRNRWPGWLQFNVDFAMNGTIPPPQGRSMQMNHWSPMDFTLFINVISWPCSDMEEPHEQSGKGRHCHRRDSGWVAARCDRARCRLLLGRGGIAALQWLGAGGA